MKKPKKCYKYGLLQLMIIVLVCVLTVLVYARCRVRALGGGLGEITGKATGLALGSIQGITEGIAAGNEAGIEMGLSAWDTSVDRVTQEVKEIGSLEVLAAGVKLRNLHEIGDTYKALYLIKGDAVFSVDLSQAEVMQNASKNEIIVRIPEPEMKVYINESDTKKLAEAQKFSFNVGAKAGIEAYLNSMKNTAKEAETIIANYDSLIEMAEESARKQIHQLVSLVCGTEYSEIQIEFKA